MAFSWSNSACVIAPLSSSSLPFAICSAESPEPGTEVPESPRKAVQIKPGETTKTDHDLR